MGRRPRGNLQTYSDFRWFWKRAQAKDNAYASLICAFGEARILEKKQRCGCSEVTQVYAATLAMHLSIVSKVACFRVPRRIAAGAIGVVGQSVSPFISLHALRDRAIHSRRLTRSKNQRSVAKHRPNNGECARLADIATTREEKKRREDNQKTRSAIRC